MELQFDQTGRLDATKKAAVDYLSSQVFVYKEYQNQIAGIRAGIAGTLAILDPSSSVRIALGLIAGPSGVSATLIIEQVAIGS